MLAKKPDLTVRLREACADPRRLARLRANLINDEPLRPFMPTYNAVNLETGNEVDNGHPPVPAIAR